MTKSTGNFKEQFYDLPINLCGVLDLEKFQVVQANSAFEAILGWKPDEIVGQAFHEFIASEEGRVNTQKLFSKIQSGIHSLSFETEFRCKNTQTRWIGWRGYADDASNLLYLIGHDITTHKETQKTLTSQTHIDALTGTFNRQLFMSVLQTETSGALRYHYAVAIVLINVDHLDEYNSLYGYAQSDACLKHIAHTLKTALRRKTDFLARLEEDKFVVLLPHNNLEKATKAAEYLRTNLENVTAKLTASDSPLKLTISLGVAAISEKAEQQFTIDQILKAAKFGVDHSKQQGGNQVSFVEELE